VPIAGRVHYLEEPPRSDVRGRGALLFLHAFPLNARMWEPQLAAFAARGWHAIAPHLRGFGEGSDPVSDPVAVSAIDDYAGDVIDLLDALHIPDAVVVGLSLGGYVALAMMRLAPRYLHGLVLADTRADADTPEGAANRDRMAQLARERGVAAITDELIPKLIGATTRRDHPAVEATVRSLAAENSVSSIVGALHALKTRPDSTPVLASIHVPALIVVGEEDAITPPAVAEGLRKAIAGSTLSILPRVGHLSSLENADAFNAALAQFLEHRV
jgi:pimeloyl-ACP methyl ester carboxylesterase